MKKYLLIFLSLIILISCSKDIDISSLVERNDLMFEVNKTTPFSGNVFQKNENGTFLLKGSFTKGLKSGEWSEYADNGQLLSIENYNNKGLLDGNYKKYHSSGQIIEEVVYKNNLKEGLTSKWNKDGHPLSEIEYKKGKKDGVAKQYEQGVLIMEIHYKDDMLHGDFKEFYQNGQVKINTYYENDKVNGRYTYFLSSGEKVREYHKKKGNFDDTYIEYFKNGDTLEIMRYDNGTRHGLSKEWYTSNHKKHKEINYKNGRAVSTKLWNRDGVLRPLLNLKNTKGTWKSIYNSNDSGKWEYIYSIFDQKQIVSSSRGLRYGQHHKHRGYIKYTDQHNIVISTDDGRWGNYKNTKYEVPYFSKNKIVLKNVKRNISFTYKRQN